MEELRDLPPEYLTRLGQEAERNARIVGCLLELPEKRRALVFACSVEHAEVLALLLNRAAGAEVAAAVTGRTHRGDRSDAVTRFREGELRFLCNIGVLTTGFDAPRTDVVCITRPTTSAILYEQMVGRGLRGEANNGTKSCLVLDVQDEGLPGEIMSYARVKHLWDDGPQ
jgi:superfamily II DNA or RNA helicase